MAPRTRRNRRSAGDWFQAIARFRRDWRCLAAGCALALASLGSAAAAPLAASLSAPLAVPPAADGADAPGAAQQLERAVAQLSDRNLRSVEAAVVALAATGEAQARTVLQALQDGRLARTRDGRVVLLRGDDDAPRIVEPLTAAEIPELTLRDVREIRISNPIRRAVTAGLADLSLADDDPAVRAAAARQFLDAPDPALLDRIEAARDRESDPAVAGLLALAAQAIVLMDPARPEAERLAVIERFEAVGTPAVRSRLLALELEMDSRLDLRRREAVAEIDRVLQRWDYLQNLWYGISLGSVLLLAAMGLAITFGVMGVINMAHGEMVMIGAYTTFVVQGVLRGIAPALGDLSLLVALPMAFLVAAAVGILIERTVIQRLYGRPLETLLATWGISLILQQLVRTLFGASNRSVEVASWMSGAFQIGQLSISYNRLWILLFALFVLAAVALVLKCTALGLQIRAVTQNRQMAENMGIRTGRVDMFTFGLGSGIAGIAGVALSQIDNVSPNLGQSYIIDSFMVIVFGGVGSLLGTLSGALTLGIATKAIEPWLGAVVAKVLILGFIIIFIQFRPQGLFPQKGRAAE